jgi:hypothetical protein
MKKIKYLFGIVLLSLIFTSCEDVVQIKLDEGSKLYVIDGFVNSLRTDQKIRVVTNDSYFSNRQAPPVANASVLLRDLTSGKVYSFGYTSNGYYVYTIKAGDTLAYVDHQYRLEVSIEGVTYTSLTTQKRTAGIDSIAALYNDGTNGGFGPPGEPYFNCLLFAKDRVDRNTDYYWVKTLRNDTLFDSSGDINLSIDGTNGAVSDVPVDSLEFTPPITFLGFKNFNNNDKVEAQIHSISRETYFFLLQAQAQINNGGLFATTPENVKTNIVTPDGAKTKAIGWFNMATVASYSRIVK